jgi:hypothetical protein
LASARRVGATGGRRKIVRRPLENSRDWLYRIKKAAFVSEGRFEFAQLFAG